MQFTIKGLKVSQFASEETLCYEATLYVDGERVARVMNQGHGGSSFVVEKFVPEHRITTIEEMLKKHGPRKTWEGHETEPRYDEIEDIVDDLAWRENEFKQMRRKAKKSTLFIRDTKVTADNLLDYNGYDMIKGFLPDEETIKFLDKEFSDGYTIINDLIPTAKGNAITVTS